MQNGDKVLVTTSHRGVFAGILKSRTGDEVTIENASMCVYWNTSMKGVLGLAAVGPSSKCRIGPSVPELLLSGVTSVSKINDKAWVKWEQKPWG